MSSRHSSDKPSASSFVRSPSPSPSVASTPSMYSQASFPRQNSSSDVFPSRNTRAFDEQSYSTRYSYQMSRASSIYSTADYHVGGDQNLRAYGSPALHNQTTSQFLEIIGEDAEADGQNEYSPSKRNTRSSATTSGSRKRSDSAQYLHERSSQRYHSSPQRRTTDLHSISTVTSSVESSRAYYADSSNRYLLNQHPLPPLPSTRESTISPRSPQIPSQLGMSAPRPRASDHYPSIYQQSSTDGHGHRSSTKTRSRTDPGALNEAPKRPPSVPFPAPSPRSSGEASDSTSATLCERHDPIRSVHHSPLDFVIIRRAASSEDLPLVPRARKKSLGMSFVDRVFGSKRKRPSSLVCHRRRLASDRARREDNETSSLMMHCDYSYPYSASVRSLPARLWSVSASDGSAVFKKKGKRFRLLSMFSK